MFALFKRPPATDQAAAFPMIQLEADPEFEWYGALEHAIREAGGNRYTMITPGDVLLACGNLHEAVHSLQLVPKVDRMGAVLVTLRRLQAARDEPAFDRAVDELAKWHERVKAQDGHPDAPEEPLPAWLLSVAVRTAAMSTRQALCASLALLRAIDAAQGERVSMKFYSRAQEAHGYDSPSKETERRRQEDDILAAFPPRCMRRPWWWRWRS